MCMQVSAVASSSYVLTRSGGGLSCGANELRQLGHSDGSEGGASRHGSRHGASTPGREPTMGGFDGTPMADEEAEEEALGAEALGADEGSSEWLRWVALPSSVDGLVVMIAAGLEHAAALTDDGRLVTWGNPDGGRLGRRKTRGMGRHALSRPALVGLPHADQRLCSVSCGHAHTVAVSEGGALWMWGQLGKDAAYSQPVRALGEKLGGAHFVRACAASSLTSECYTLAVAVPPAAEEEEGW